MQETVKQRLGSNEMAVKASLKYLRVTPRKVRIVANLIRGKDLDEALQITRFTRRKAAAPMFKLLKSAEANADHLGNVDIDNLYVKTVTIDTGPTLKRVRPRAMGRATLVRKRTSHVTIVLDER